MLKASNLSKYYGQTKALDGASFKIETGEVAGLLGPNGAGKTTTIRLLTTYLHPSFGTAEVCGFDILKESSEVKKQIGYLPELPPLYPEMRVLDYLYYIAKIKGIKKRELKEHVELAIERCNLSEVRRRLCLELSKGFKQRVGLAASIVHRPKVLILDEPTSGLDPRQVLEIRKLIEELKKTTTILLSTHILSEVEQVCSKVIIINKGRVLIEGNLKDLIVTKPLEEFFLDAIRDRNIEQTESTRMQLAEI